MANNEIESAYKEKKPSLLFTHQDLKAEINFENKEVTFLRTGAIKTALRKDGRGCDTSPYVMSRILEQVKFVTRRRV